MNKEQNEIAGDDRGHDTKGSRKALGAMNAKLRAKVGALEAGNESLRLVRDEYKRLADEYRAKWLELQARAQLAEPVQGEAVAGWRRSDRPYEMTAYPSVCATWHRHGFPVQALYTSPAKPDAELVELLRQCLDAMRTPYSDTRLMARIDAKLAEVNKP